MTSIPKTLIGTVCPILYSQFIKRKGADWAAEELIEILKPKLDGIAEGIIQLRYGDYQSALSHFQVKYYLRNKYGVLSKVALRS